MRVATSSKEMTAHERADLETPHVGVIVLECVMVPSATHAKRLKDALDEILMGHQEEQENGVLRHRWRDCRGCWDQDDADPEQRESSRAMWWGIVLSEAQRMLRSGATEFPIYDSDEIYSVISKKVKRGH